MFFLLYHLPYVYVYVVFVVVFFPLLMQLVICDHFGQCSADWSTHNIYIFTSSSSTKTSYTHECISVILIAVDPLDLIRTVFGFEEETRSRTTNNNMYVFCSRWRLHWAICEQAAEDEWERATTGIGAREHERERDREREFMNKKAINVLFGVVQITYAFWFGCLKKNKKKTMRNANTNIFFD